MMVLVYVGEALLQGSQLSGMATKPWLAASIPPQWLPDNVPSHFR